MNKKVKLDLMALELMNLNSNEECFLEVELLQDGEMRGQDKNKKFYTVSAQIPNPINGGGDLKNYKTLGQIYDIMEKRQK